MNVVNTDTCFYCQDECESLKHFFFECVIVKCFWSQIEEIIESVQGNQCNITNSAILSCKIHANSKAAEHLGLLEVCKTAIY